MKHLVKRRGHLEKFDERKVYASCYAACLSHDITRGEAEKVCEKVTKEVKKWIKDKKEVTSDGLFREIGKSLAKHSKEAAYLYKTHRDIS
tara:strand:- start:3019 stop:3288 length:270 start_codon:yes stop_codon:yes gene_type:complete